MRFTPEKITTLGENEIFVFGSNLAGIHGAGAARLAMDRFGAVFGKGIGLFGKTYALPTKDRHIETLPLEEIQKMVDYFIDYASVHVSLVFLVTKVGCGLAGYTEEQIAPLFKKALQYPNIILPESFYNIIKENEQG